MNQIKKKENKEEVGDFSIIFFAENPIWFNPEKTDFKFNVINIFLSFTNISHIVGITFFKSRKVK